MKKKTGDRSIMPAGVEDRIDAAPAKAFFVWMITRDIELQDAILDLLDNCIDGIRRIGSKAGGKPYSGRYAHITFNDKLFCIEDNCGGIPINTAREYAFRMGRPIDTNVPTKGNIGVYGIGMKRAIFKMGQQCSVHSHTAESTFEVAIDKEWLQDDKKWRLNDRPVESELRSFGTKITVSELRPGIKEQFTKGSHFEKEVFPRAVQSAYSFLIAKGFEVKVNGVAITSELPSLLWESPGPEKKEESKIRPYIYEATIDGVSIFLAVGFWRPLSSGDDDPTDKRYASDNAGWTVVCNDRVVLSCDQTRATGWGRAGVPKFHTQFIAIAGYVEFYSEKHPERLPMTTTKRGVDLSSKTYDIVRERMQEGMKYFTKFTNDWKGREDEQKEMFRRARRLTLQEICEYSRHYLKQSSVQGDAGQRQSIPPLPQRPKETTEKRISFIRPIRQIKAASEYLFDRNDARPADVGAECFDRTLKLARKK